MIHRPALVRSLAVASLAAALLALAISPSRAQDPNECDEPGDSPNVIVGDLYEIERHGKVGDVTAFSVGTYSCNVGTCWLQWITGGGDNRHPTIGQNAFRLADGRIEQVGQSWLKHGFFALSEELCNTGCLGTDGDHLGVNCADPYSASLNGQQTRLGPKFEVNPATGFHPHPVTDQNRTGDAIYKRLQLRDRDIAPLLNPGARYFVEGQYIAQDDAAAGNHNDNASYREVVVIDRGAGEFHLDFAADTVRTRPAILAWSDSDPEVVITHVDDPDGGRFWLAAKATDLGNGTWSYEYAVQNLTSHRAARTFGVPTAPNVALSQVGFHDVDYHSGEPFDGTDWSASRDAAGTITWSTLSYTFMPNANALRWGTLYNFRFVADAPPVPVVVVVGLFRPGAPGDPRRLGAALIGPDPCNGDGACDPGESCVSCPGECDSQPDLDGDGLGFCDDCDDNDGKVWGTPGEARRLMARKALAGAVTFTWSDPEDPGALEPQYEMLRSDVPSDFATSPACLREAEPRLLKLTDVDAGTAGRFLSYLVRARSTCTVGLGTVGFDSFGVERPAADCP